MSLLSWDKFICQSLPSPLLDWVKDWERQESGIYLVYFDPNNSQWQEIAVQGDSRGYINLLHAMGFAYPQWIG